MKKSTKIIIAILSLASLTLVTSRNVEAANSVSMYRMYNPHSGEHFYTATLSERDSLINSGWTYEGIGWNAPTTGKPVYRLYNRNAGDHHYTTSVGERNSLIRSGWKDEGIGWQSGGTVPSYRQYNRHARAGSHNYTTSKAENDMLVKAGWKGEGIGWYGVKPEKKTDYAGPIPKNALTADYMRKFFYIVEDSQPTDEDGNPEITDGNLLGSFGFIDTVMPEYVGYLMPESRANYDRGETWATKKELQNLFYALSPEFDGKIPMLNMVHARHKGEVYYFGVGDGGEEQVKISKVRVNTDKSADVDVIVYDPFDDSDAISSDEYMYTDRFHMVLNPHVDTTSATPFYYSIDKITRLG